MIRRPPRSTLFPTRRSSDLVEAVGLVEPALVAVRGMREQQHGAPRGEHQDRKSTRLNSSHQIISYAVFCLKKKKKKRKKYKTNKEQNKYKDEYTYKQQKE